MESTKSLSRHTRTGLPLALAVAIALPLGAAPTRADAVKKAADASLGITVGTLGIGIEGSKMVSPSIAVRVGLSSYSYSHTFNQQSVDYDGRLKLGGVTALGDFFPSKRGSFHLSAGIAFNNTRADATARPGSSTGTITLNGTDYTPQQIGVLKGSVRFPKAGPYLGIGFGKPTGRGVRFVSDLGVIISSKPTVSLTRIATPGSLDPTTADGQNLESDIAAQQAKSQSDLDKLKIYPVLSIGMVYNF